MATKILLDTLFPDYIKTEGRIFSLFQCTICMIKNSNYVYCVGPFGICHTNSKSYKRLHSKLITLFYYLHAVIY